MGGDHRRDRRLRLPRHRPVRAPVRAAVHGDLRDGDRAGARAGRLVRGRRRPQRHGVQRLPDRRAAGGGLVRLAGVGAAAPVLRP